MKNNFSITHMHKESVIHTTKDRVQYKLYGAIISGVFLGLMFLLGLEGAAQSSLDTLVESAVSNNKTMLSVRKYYEAEMINARTGNSPSNPEIEYAYLWGTPEELGDRVDFAITQSFDFPTAYSSRSKLSKITREQAGLRLKSAEQEIVLRTRKLWVNAVYFNKKASVLDDRLYIAQQIQQAYLRMLEEGEANQLQLNQAKLKVIALTNELSNLYTQQVANDAELKRMNGGEFFVVRDSIFPESENIILDSLILMYQTGPQNESVQTEVVRMEQQKDVAFNQKLPKLSAGYYQETILGVKLAGVRAGITIPLWENANAVKSAKANVAFAESDALRFWEQQELLVRQKYNQWLIVRGQVDEMKELMDNAANDKLLLSALEGGEISLTQYYYESDFYFQNQFDLIDLELRLNLLETELLKVMY